MVALRELDAGSIPDSTWTNKHLVYTHGYGPVAAAANLQTDGEPSYLVQDIPLSGELADSSPAQPGIYFGENLSGYAVVDTKVAEQQASTGATTEETRYTGAGGREDVELPAEEPRSRCGSAIGTSSCPVSSRRTHACSTSATSVSGSAPRHRS